MTPAESKYFNTARRMEEAFLSLMEKKDFAYITVTEICKAAGVNRSTFYLHYETVGDLLTECVDHMNQRFAESFRQSTSEFQQSIQSATLDQLFLITPEYLMPYLSFISRNRTAFRVVLNKPGVMLADKTYAMVFEDTLDQILQRHAVPERDRAYMLSFYINGMMGIVRRWLQSDCSDPAEDVAKIMMTVIRR